MRGKVGVSCIVSCMSLVGAVLVLAFLWAAIHAIRFLFPPARTSILPSINLSRRSSFPDPPTTQVFLNLFHLRFQTTACNIYHDCLATALKKERRPRLSLILMRFYDLGSVFGILGMLTGLVILSWTCGLSALSLMTKYNRIIPRSVPPGLARRGVEYTGTLLSEHGSLIKPIESHFVFIVSRGF